MIHRLIVPLLIEICQLSNSFAEKLPFRKPPPQAVPGLRNRSDLPEADGPLSGRKADGRKAPSSGRCHHRLRSCREAVPCHDLHSRRYLRRRGADMVRSLSVAASPIHHGDSNKPIVEARALACPRRGRVGTWSLWHSIGAEGQLATTSSRSEASASVATPKSGTAAIGMESSQTASAQGLAVCTVFALPDSVRSLLQKFTTHRSLTVADLVRRRMGNRLSIVGPSKIG